MIVVLLLPLTASVRTRDVGTDVIGTKPQKLSSYLSFLRQIWSFRIFHSNKQCNIMRRKTQKSPQWSWNHKNKLIFLFDGSAGRLGLTVLSPSGFEQQEVPHVQSWSPVSHDWLQILTDWSAEPGPDRGEAEDETCSSSQCCYFMLFLHTYIISVLFVWHECHCLHYLYTICFSKGGEATPPLPNKQSKCIFHVILQMSRCEF